MNFLDYIGIIITATIPIIIGAAIVFFVTYLQNKSEEKRKLKLWKIIVYQELMQQRKKILGFKNAFKSLGENVFIDSKLASSNIIYDYDSAFKILGEKDFDIFLKHTKTIEYFDLAIEKYSFARLNNAEKKYEYARYATVDIIKEYNFKELDLIIDKIGQGLDKKIKLKLEIKIGEEIK